MTTDRQPQSVREAAEKLAQRLASEEGRRALAEAAKATKIRAEARAEAGQLDPSLLQKRITF